MILSNAECPKKVTPLNIRTPVPSLYLVELPVHFGSTQQERSRSLCRQYAVLGNKAGIKGPNRSFLMLPFETTEAGQEMFSPIL